MRAKTTGVYLKKKKKRNLKGLSITATNKEIMKVIWGIKLYVELGEI